MKKSKKSIIYIIVGIIVGSTLVSPIQARVTAITLKWLKKNYYSKKQSNNKYYSKTAINSKLSAYYSKTSVDNLLADYLTSSNAAGTYLTQSGAASTYLTQTNAASTYLTQSNAATSYLPLSGGTLAGGLTGTSITGSSFAYSSTQTKSKVVPVAMFTRIDPTMTLTWSGSLGVYRSGGGSFGLESAIDLPQGAQITQLTLYLTDTNDTKNITAYLIRQYLPSEGGDVLSSVTSTGTSASPQYAITTGSIANSTVDNSYYYRLSVDLTNADADTITFRAIKVTYTTTSIEDQ